MLWLIVKEKAVLILQTHGTFKRVANIAVLAFHPFVPRLQ